MHNATWMFHVILTLALLPQAASRPFPQQQPAGVAVGAAGTLKADVKAHDVSAAGEQKSKLLRREAALLESSPTSAPTNHIRNFTNNANCETGQFAYTVLSDGSLALVDMGGQKSGKTEVRRLTDVTTPWDTEGNPVVTKLHTTASKNNNGEWTFLSDGANNLVGVNSGMTSSGFTEVHALEYAGSGSTPWQTFKENLATVLPTRAAFDEWDFLLDSADNLIQIKKGPETNSTRTELTMLSATSDYQTVLVHTATGLEYSASTTDNGDWSFLLDASDNLICIRRPTANDHTIQIKKFTKASNYASGDPGNGDIALPMDDASDEVHWVFERNPSTDDILCIKEGPTTRSGKTEIHTLSLASGYTTFSAHQYESGASCRNPFYIDSGGSR